MEKDKDIKGEKSTLVKEGDWVALIPNSVYEDSGLEMLEQIKQELTERLGVPKEYLGKKE